jgi:hypothetical protein
MSSFRPHRTLCKSPLPYNTSNMPCSFSGVFYVMSKSTNTLHCFVKDETGERTNVTMTLYFASDEQRPTPAQTEYFSVNSAYFVVGDFLITNGTQLSVCSS